MKNKFVLVFFSIILIIAIFIVLWNIKENRFYNRPFIKYKYPETIKVHNGTNFSKADTIILTLANQIFKIDTAEIFIYYVPEHLNSESMQFYGIVQQSEFDNKKFIIFVNKKLSTKDLLETLSHEFVHIDQYDRGDLKIIGNYFIWKGDTVDMRDVKYEYRPFEKEAFSKQSYITKKLVKLLYN